MTNDDDKIINETLERNSRHERRAHERIKINVGVKMREPTAAELLAEEIEEKLREVDKKFIKDILEGVPDEENTD